jgi:hypothetical protein
MLGPIMWGAVLFFITIVMVTPGGRAVASQYAQQTIALFTAQLPDALLVMMALSTLACLVLVCGRPSERMAERWILQIHVLDSDPAVRR